MAKIQTVSEKQYKRERLLLDRADALIKSDVATSGQSAHILSHPDCLIVDNDMRGRVAQYELYHNTPESFVAYIGSAEPNGMGVDRQVGRTWPVTTWTGLPIGNATETAKWPVQSFVGSHMRQYHAIINGREFTGRGFGTGMAVVFKETAKSKRKREKGTVAA